MKRICIILALGLLAAGCTDKGKQPEAEEFASLVTLPERYTVYRTADPIVVDGVLSERSWQLAETTTDFADISGEGFPEPLQRTYAQMVWDDECLYIAGTVFETNVTAKLTQRDTIIFYDNDFEVFIDPYDRGQGYFEFETNARGVLFDLIMDRPYRDGGDFFVPWDCKGVQVAVHVDGTLNDPSDTDTKWTVEMAIPGESLRRGFQNPLGEGRYWRLGFSRVEWNTKPEDNWVWSPTGRIDMHMPERWGYIFFDGKTVGEAAEVKDYPYDMDAYFAKWLNYYAKKYSNK